MFITTLLSFLTAATFAATPAATPESPAATQPATSQPIDLPALCSEQMAKLSGPYDKKMLDPACAEVKMIDDCKSVNGAPIYHFDREGQKGPGSKRVLSISVIHGDEPASGSVNRAWMARLKSIDPRNSWRVIPIVNPDGMKLNTRMNANKVDLNRNFPSQDWEKNALAYWKQDYKGDARRFPGPSSASEAETRCLIKHIEEFKPDFIISIHTPLGVLDFDGPRIGNPGFKPLPWVSLGNYPGSLGRYMWADKKIPVLTIELRGNQGLKRLEEFDKLQDITGTVAIQADKILQKKTSKK